MFSDGAYSQTPTRSPTTRSVDCTEADRGESTGAQQSSCTQPTGAAAEDCTKRFEREVVPLTGYLLGHAQALTKQRSDTEDLVQDTMLKAYVSIRTFREGSNPRPWLYRIMVNTWIDRYRHALRRPTEQLCDEFTDSQLTRHGTLVYGAAQSAESDALQNIPSDAESALRALQKDLRETVYYADVAGYPNTEIAAMLDIPVGTVGSRLHRGRHELRKMLLGEAA